MQPQPARFSPASEISSRTATQGYAQIPNSVIECQLLLTPAELAFVLIVCRRGENTVSDKHWTEWTGREARIKDSAIRGLKEKGLHVRGRGNAAKYHFDRNHWDSWVRTQPRSKRARTIDRSKSVTPKPGQQIHQECRERGCGRLCESGVIPFPAPNFEQPVAQTEKLEVPKPPPKESPPDPPKAVVAHTALGNEVPPPYTSTGHPNELWVAIKPALREAQRRIHTARNPKAYEARVIADALARARGGG